jgi:hypothetical protein
MKNKASFKSMAVIAMFSVLSFAAKAQVPTYTCEIRNAVLISPTEYQFDIFMLRTGETPFEYAGMQMGINFNNAVIPEGATITASLTGLNTVKICNAHKKENISLAGIKAKGIKITVATPLCGPGNGTMISNVAPGNLICQVKLTSSIAFVPKTNFDLSWSFTTPDPWATKVVYYAPGAKAGADCTNQASHIIGK